jgi:hypothetical protein
LKEQLDLVFLVRPEWEKMGMDGLVLPFLTRVQDGEVMDSLRRAFCAISEKKKTGWDLLVWFAFFCFQEWLAFFTMHRPWDAKGKLSIRLAPDSSTRGSTREDGHRESCLLLPSCCLVFPTKLTT